MENLKPDVSVLLPVRRWRETTADAVQSILSQTLRSLELLLIGQDDVQSLADRLPPDRRIRLLARRQAGIVGALNTGLAQARGTYIARMDDDDLARPTRLAAQLEHLQGRSDTELCGTLVRFIDGVGQCDSIGNGNRYYERWLNELRTNDEIRTACFIESPMPHPTLMAHRDVWQRLQGYRDFDGPEDYDLVLRALLLGIRMGKPAGVLHDWREHPDRLTRTDLRYRREAFARVRAWAASQPQSRLGLAEGRTVWLCGTGRNARHWHDALVQHGVEVNGFVDLPRARPRQIKRGKPVIDYQQLPRRRGDALVITALSQPPARQRLQDFFDRHAWQAGRDYLFGG